ncbi:MAG: Rpn family recombination-promoting nuclease/putative transposase [Defluviitaleaceae bacterium]|nr:Rpn family recombination-promoting nuclease/putative transposase [Defluviitaleaceae bacterium]
MSKRILTEQELAEKRGNLAITHDKVTEHMLTGKNGNKIFTGISNATRKAANLSKLAKIDNMTVQPVAEPHAYDGRRMYADARGTAIEKGLLSATITQIGLEVQRSKQLAFAERIVLSFADQMKVGFIAGEEYEDAPNVMQMAFSGFNLKDVIDPKSKEFVYRVTLATEENGVLKRMLEEKYNIFIIELPKLPRTIDKVPENQRELWEICRVIKTPYKNFERMLKMTTLATPTAKLLANEFKKTMKSQQTVRQIIDWDEEVERLRREREREKAKARAEGIAKGMEKAKAEYEPQLAAQSNQLAARDKEVERLRSLLTNNNIDYTLPPPKIAKKRSKSTHER